MSESDATGPIDNDKRRHSCYAKAIMRFACGIESQRQREMSPLRESTKSLWRVVSIAKKALIRPAQFEKKDRHNSRRDREETPRDKIALTTSSPAARPAPTKLPTQVMDRVRKAVGWRWRFFDSRFGAILRHAAVSASCTMWSSASGR